LATAGFASKTCPARLRVPLLGYYPINGLEGDFHIYLFSLPSFIAVPFKGRTMQYVNGFSQMPLKDFG
jgi:hypothetical protein